MEEKNKKRRYVTIVAVIIIAVIIFLAFYYKNMNNQVGEEAYKKIEKIPELGKMEQEQGIQVTERGVRYIVDPKKIKDGGPPMDGIPSLDSPKFVSVDEADKWIEDNELILSIEYQGVKRAYPLQIMTWHEIVNDKIGDSPVLITYCPLCGSGIAYERTIDGEEVEFGTSGKLYNSNLVMYDRKTNSYWSQIDGKAIVGELTGKELKAISMDTIAWRGWKEKNKDAQVLSKDTGFNRPYGNDPYGNYYEYSFLLFDVENSDNSVHPKTVIYGIEIDGRYKAYKDKDIALNSSLEDEVNGTKIKIEKDDIGQVAVTNLKNNKEIVKERDFWFAWYAFHPDTSLYEK